MDCISARLCDLRTQVEEQGFAACCANLAAPYELFVVGSRKTYMDLINAVCQELHPRAYP